MGTIGTLVGGTAGAIAVLIAFGIPPLVARATTPATAAEGIAGVVRSLVLFGMLDLLVPALVKIYIDFGVKLSTVTASIYRASTTAETIWLPTFLLLFASETVVFYLLYRDPDRRKPARQLSILTTLACGVAVLFIVMAIAVPLWKLLPQVG
jgi:type II secretory pathway component PulF